MNTTNRYHNKSIASSPSNGIVNPDFHKIADAYSIPYQKLENISEIISFLEKPGPIIIEINTQPFEYIGPKLMQSNDDDINELINMFPFLKVEDIKSSIPT